MYQNSRAIAANYLNAALNNALQPVQPPSWVRVYDKIDVMGIDAFTADGKKNLKDLGLDMNPGLLATIGEVMEEAEDHATFVKWMDYAMAQYPEEERLLVLGGDSQVKAGNKEAARKYYEKARTISSAKNNAWLTGMIEEKLKTL